MKAKARVVVLGGGFAGLETAFLLRSQIGDRVDVTLVSDSDDFLFKPNTIYIPFGADPTSLLIPLPATAAKRDIAFVPARVRGIDSDRRYVHLAGRELAYDYLVIATGATMRPGEIPGLADHAETIWTPAEMLSLRARLETLEQRLRGGAHQTVLFAVPPNNKCAGPLYEIVFMLETWLRRRGLRDRAQLVWTTYEDSFIQAFGPKLHDVVVEEFAARGIQGHLGERLAAVTPSRAQYDNGNERPFDLMVSFPPYVAAFRSDDFPTDDRGFLKTDSETRRVAGRARVFAPGDAGDFPVKQAFLAFLQADAAAETIAAELEGREPRFGFDPVSMCVMEQFDKATFAQVPLQVTGDPRRPVIVRPDADGDYRVGVSPLWRLGKRMLGIYLPLRFGHGQPFHAGVPWKVMDIGLKGMSKALARR
jgi:NADH dehydrogenase FAD-containing subunit